MSLNRIKGLQQRMAEAGIEAAIILYSRDLLYYTGTTQPCILLVTPKEFHLSGHTVALDMHMMHPE